jgi:hypothetical protein
LFLAVAFEPATVDSRELYSTTVRRVVKVDIYIHQTKATNCKRHAISSKNNCITKPGIERLLFLAVGFEPATVDSRDLYATTERRVVKVDIYIHQTKATSYIRHATSSKNSCITKSGIEHLLFLAVGFEPATVDSKQLYATTERRMVKVSVYTHRTKVASQIL